MASVLDANLFVRYFTNDDPQKARAVEQLLKSKKKFVVPDIVFAEIEWTLRSFYRQPKQLILEHLGSLLLLENLSINYSLMAKTLLLWKEHTIDFVDAYLAAYTWVHHLENLYSFDQSIDKIKTIKRLEP